jgi:hypothetical protein
MADNTHNKDSVTISKQIFNDMKAEIESLKKENKTLMYSNVELKR